MFAPLRNLNAKFLEGENILRANAKSLTYCIFFLTSPLGSIHLSTLSQSLVPSVLLIIREQEQDQFNSLLQQIRYYLYFMRFCNQLTTN